MESPRQDTAESSQNEQQSAALIEVERKLWKAVEELRVNSGLKFDEYAKTILGLIFLGYANQQATKDEPNGAKINLPAITQWDHLLAQPTPQIGDALNKAMYSIESENQRLSGTLQTDYNRSENPALAELLRIFADVSNEATGDTFASFFEFFLERFARASGQRSAEFSTPREITSLLIELVKPERGMSVYDPCVGTAGFLREAMRYVARTDQGDSELSLFGQEISQEILSIGRMHLAVNGEFDADLCLGNTLKDPRHIDHDQLMQFDRVIANPPFSVNLRGVDLGHDPYHRFRYGAPPKGNGDFAFIHT